MTKDISRKSNGNKNGSSRDDRSDRKIMSPMIRPDGMKPATPQSPHLGNVSSPSIFNNSDSLYHRILMDYANGQSPGRGNHSRRSSARSGISELLPGDDSIQSIDDEPGRNDEYPDKLNADIPAKSKKDRLRQRLVHQINLPSEVPPSQKTSLKSDDPSIMGNSQVLERHKSLVKFERSRSIHQYRRSIAAGIPVSQLPKPNRLMNSDGRCQRVWEFAANLLTFWAPDIFIKWFIGSDDPEVIQAWREKVSLVSISLGLCVFLGFFTFFFQSTSCPKPTGQEIQFESLEVSGYYPKGSVLIRGKMYDLSEWILNNHPVVDGLDLQQISNSDIPENLSNLFRTTKDNSCDKNILQNCLYSDLEPHCHDWDSLESKLKDKMVGRVIYKWKDVTETNYMIFNGKIIDMNWFVDEKVKDKLVFSQEKDDLLLDLLGKDATMALTKLTDNSDLAACLVHNHPAGVIEQEIIMCVAANVILNIALVIICSLVMIRFLLAVVFGWFLSWQLGKIQATRSIFQLLSKQNHEYEPGTGVTAATNPQTFSLFHKIDFTLRYKELYTLCLVTAYSEDEDGLRTTIDSLAQTDYHDEYKLIFIVADGIVKGAGNSKPTGDIILGLIELDEVMHGPVEYVADNGDSSEDIDRDQLVSCSNAEPQSYEAIGQGSKKHNMAKVYCGYYRCSSSRRTPVILVYKCGTPAESNNAKPGNRGKRDSQIILMDFLSKITFDEPLSPFQFDLFYKWSHIMTVQNGSRRKVTPDMFEIMLMVDADTRVMPDSLSRLVSVMQRDPQVMGLCGETRIMNKTESWVSMIQVFEYYVSHHLAKSFESVFGGVTCLPGCFCMYRIKAPIPLPEESRHIDNPEQMCSWVPILSNPDIVADYSESTVDTLHKKNLLLLGEDRYLTTLMLRIFPRRKMMFVPKAICKTQVPSKFQVLLSQRRRWINSTIHNLMELVLVRELCGIFCFSMQFVVFLELIGTATLPAAIIFTMVLVINSIIGEPQWVPLGLLGGILGLPAVLILFTTRKVVYIFYMLVYLLALPIWNFVLPTYAFWHFDDFSWGQTRKVDGETKGDNSHGHSTDSTGEFESKIPKKRWAQWESLRRKRLKAFDQEDPFGKLSDNWFESGTQRYRRKSRLASLFLRINPRKNQRSDLDIPAKSAKISQDYGPEAVSSASQPTTSTPIKRQSFYPNS